MIYLDGFGYYTNKTDYSDIPMTFASVVRGLTGALLVLETGIEQQQFTIRLNVSQPEAERLKQSFIKCHNTTTFLTYVDERDVTYASVWFAALGEPKPASEALFDPATNAYFDPTKRFIIEIQLTVNATSLA